MYVDLRFLVCGESKIISVSACADFHYVKQNHVRILRNNTCISYDMIDKCIVHCNNINAAQFMCMCIQKTT